MLKKILIASLAFTVYLHANSDTSLDCENEFEQCATICTSKDSSDKEAMCIEKCEMLYDKCILLLNNSDDSNNEFDPSTNEEMEQNEEYIQSEIDSNNQLDENLDKIQYELDKKQED